MLSRRTARVGAYIVMAWLLCIAINLLTMRMFDIAVRDVALAVGAFALARFEEVRSGATGHVRTVRTPVGATTY